MLDTINDESPLHDIKTVTEKAKPDASGTSSRVRELQLRSRELAQLVRDPICATWRLGLNVCQQKRASWCAGTRAKRHGDMTTTIVQLELPMRAAAGDRPKDAIADGEDNPQSDYS